MSGSTWWTSISLPYRWVLPGAIVFSGICVGRGYINDPERTRLAFMTDPHHPGERLYQAGDYGRWLPDGKLEFLGRRDNQVKIRGFRIEIGEIDNALLRVPGVRDAAVVVVERADHSKQLVAFYSGDRPLATDLLRDRLAESLPEYMVPPVFHWRDRLPLTANSKIDRKALTAVACTLDVVEETHDAPTTPTERRLAAAWAKVLGTPQDQIGRQDHFFFDCGGSSLSAVKLAITLDRVVSLTDVTRHPSSRADRRPPGAPAARRRRSLTAVMVDQLALSAPSSNHQAAPLREEPKMPYSSPAAQLDRQVGRLPVLRIDGRPAMRSAGSRRTGTRFAPRSPSHGSVMIRGLGLRDAAEAGSGFPAIGTRPA